MSFPGTFRSSATLATASPASSCEFIQGSGSFSVRDATYLSELSRTAENGLSFLLGQTL